jgi:phospholipid-binding lipoprotein MlaA
MSAARALWRGAAALLALAALAGAGGCASVPIPADAGSNPADPFERMNRRVYAFNDRFDKAVAEPAARTYNAVLPKVMRDCVSNFFDNLHEMPNAIYAALQGRAAEAGRDTGRLIINTTVGVGGCFDVARQAGLERARQNFGLTMGRWGMSPGPYLVLPVLGPSTVRQTVGLIPDYFGTDPIGYLRPIKDEYYLETGRLLSDRAELVESEQLIEQAALDRYSFLRDGYLQRLRSRVYDGSPPPAPVEEDPDAPDSAPPAAPARK